MKSKKIIYSLQVMRIFAAFIVLLYHIIYIFGTKLGLEEPISLFNFGKSGVHLFFVLSGFVMYMVHKKDIGLGISLGRAFAWKRFIRIYPTYWVLTSFVVVAMLFIPGEVSAEKYNLGYIFESYSLFRFGQMEGAPIISVAWSLCHEVKFYFLFFLLILIGNKKVRGMLIGIMLFLTIIFSFGGLIWDFNYLTEFYFSSFNFLFLFGVFSAWVTEKHQDRFHARGFIYLSITFFVITCLISNLIIQKDGLFMDLLFGLASFMVITSFACHERFYSLKNGVSPFQLSRKTLIMADATYCLYLIHIPIYIAVFHVNRYLGLSLVPFVIIMVLSAIVGSLIYYNLIEYPLIKMIKSLVGKRKAPVLVADKREK